MIDFKLKSIDEIPNEVPISYPDILKYEFEFSVLINNLEYFKSNNFPFYEFLSCIEVWKNQIISTNDNDDLNYYCMETDENPLISFKYNLDGYLINSPWRLFDCEIFFSKEELLEFFKKLINQGQSWGGSMIDK